MIMMHLINFLDAWGLQASTRRRLRAHAGCVKFGAGSALVCARNWMGVDIKVLSPGDGKNKPEPGQQCTMHYVGKVRWLFIFRFDVVRLIVDNQYSWRMALSSIPVISEIDLLSFAWVSVKWFEVRSTKEVLLFLADPICRLGWRCGSNDERRKGWAHHLAGLWLWTRRNPGNNSTKCRPNLWGGTYWLQLMLREADRPQ